MRRVVFASAALLVQCAAVGWLIWRYERVVAAGVEVRVKCSAHDPYDPFRGRYLRVNAEVSTTNLSEDVRLACEDRAAGEPLPDLHVRLEKGGDGLWRAAEGAFGPRRGGVWIKSANPTIYPTTEEEAAENGGAGGYRARVDLPDWLFVNERTAPEAERILAKATDGKGAGAVAVYRVLDGEVVLTDVETGGKSVTELARGRKQKKSYGVTLVSGSQARRTQE